MGNCHWFFPKSSKHYQAQIPNSLRRGWKLQSRPGEVGAFNLAVTWVCPARLQGLPAKPARFWRGCRLQSRSGEVGVSNLAVKRASPARIVCAYFCLTPPGEAFLGASTVGLAGSAFLPGLVGAPSPRGAFRGPFLGRGSARRNHRWDVGPIVLSFIPAMAPL